MYESFYGLKAKPFAIVPDPRFLYWGGPHSIAFTMLEYGILSHAGFTVITGEIGAGKTTLIRHLLAKLPSGINVGFLPGASGGQGRLLQWIMMAFNQDFDGQSDIALFRNFHDYLMKQTDAGMRNVLIVDEAQTLGSSALEELRLISNVNTHEHELLQIVLSGQPELKRLLGAPEMTQFAQRISSDFHLTLLSREEVVGYVGHRLAEAGADHFIISQEACQLIHYVTQGTPRLINTVCESALMYGFAMEAPLITTDIVQRVLDDKRRYGVVPVGPANQLQN